MLITQIDCCRVKNRLIVCMCAFISRCVCVHVRVCVGGCIRRLLDIPQGTPALSGGLMWLVSVLIITISPHASAAACPTRALSPAPPPCSREDSPFTLCFTLVAFTTDELFVGFFSQHFQTLCFTETSALLHPLFSATVIR